MKKLLSLIIFFLITGFIGCSEEKDIDRFFEKKMSEMHKGASDYEYSKIYKEINVISENDAVIIFTENDKGEEKIFIAYLKKENSRWNWMHTRGTTVDSPIKYNYMNNEPYIYSGAISDNSISKVYVGDKEAKIIDIDDEKRFWYSINDSTSAQVKIIKNNGEEEILDQQI